MKAVVAAFNQEKALVGAFSVIVQTVVEPMDRFTALVVTVVSFSDLESAEITETAPDCRRYKCSPPHNIGHGVTTTITGEEELLLTRA